VFNVFYRFTVNFTVIVTVGLQMIRAKYDSRKLTGRFLNLSLMNNGLEKQSLLVAHILPEIVQFPFE